MKSEDCVPSGPLPLRGVHRLLEHMSMGTTTDPGGCEDDGGRGHGGLLSAAPMLVPMLAWQGHIESFLRAI